eukprot:2673479-Amphidinium_carterae.1
MLHVDYVRRCQDFHLPLLACACMACCQLEWDSCGGEKLGSQELLVTVLLSLASYIPEALMSELLKDSRLCVQLQCLEVLFQEEVAYVDNLSSGLWELLAGLVRKPAFLLRDKVMPAVS